MDGIHDMGGMHGFGKVEPEENEPVYRSFHAAWEGRCLALNRAMGAIGAWTIDEGRAGIEQLPPDVYLVVVLLRQMGAASLESDGCRARPCRRGRDRRRPCAACRQADETQAYCRRCPAHTDARLIRQRRGCVAGAASRRRRPRARTKRISTRRRTPGFARYARGRLLAKSRRSAVATFFPILHRNRRR